MTEIAPVQVVNSSEWTDVTGAPGVQVKLDLDGSALVRVTQPAPPAHGSAEAWAQSALGMCRNCGKSRSEHCRGHLMRHCSGFCYGTRPPVTSEPGTVGAVAWELSHTWAAPVEDEPEPARRPWQEAGSGWQAQLDPPSSRSEE